MHLLRRHVRTISTRVRPHRTGTFVNTLRRETNDTMWHTLTALRRSVDFQEAPVLIPEYERWRPLLPSKGLALTLAQMKGDSGPLWLALYLLAFRIRTCEDAYPAGLDLAYAHLSAAQPQFHGPLLIFALAGLSRFNLFVPIRRVVDTFLTTNLTPHTNLYFNMFIQALTITPTQSTETAQVIVKLLERMDARKLELFPETYDRLLNDQLVTIHLAHFLRNHMTRHSAVPTTAQLEAYLRIFVKDGKAKDVTETYSAIVDNTKDTPEISHEDALLLANRGIRRINPLERANKILLGVRTDSTAAAAFLRRLLAPKFLPEPRPLFNLKNLDLKQPKITIIPRTKPRYDIYAFTSALSSLSANWSANGAALVSLFESAIALHGIEPTVVTYTVLLRGLYARGEWKLAMKYWDIYYKSGLPIDRRSLGVGMRVLTRAEKPHVAYGLLHQWAYRTNLSQRELDLVDQSGRFRGWDEATIIPPEKGAPYRVSVSSITLNDWLASLIRIHRPDVVFATWDALVPLLNITPDVRTLTLVLSATRLAHRLNSTSLKAVVVRMSYEFRDTFGANHADPPEETVSVDAAEEKLNAILGPPTADSPHPYTPSLWRGRLPHDHARLLFLQVLFGSAQDPAALMDVEPPARASRKRAPSEEGEEVWGGLVLGLPKWGVDTWEAPEWEILLKRRKVLIGMESPISDEAGEVDPAPRAEDDVSTVARKDRIWRWDSYHPSIIPTNEGFLHYIILLGITGRASEIARVLAWMRHLEIVPHRSTLGAALMYWGEVSGRAILVEKLTCQRKPVESSTPTDENDTQPPWLRGPLAEDAQSAIDLSKQEEKEKVLGLADMPGEYVRLIEWLQEWVPLSSMPGPRSLAKWTRIIERLRDGAQPVWEAEQLIAETEKEEEEEMMKESYQNHRRRL